jgi:hypothetical protein
MTAEEKIHEWVDEYGYGKEPLFIQRLREYLSDDQIARVLIVLEHTCRECWNADIECQCSNEMRDRDGGASESL